MSKISTNMSEAPATWSVRPATFSERLDTERDITNVGPSAEEDSGCASLEEDSGSTLEDEASLEEETGVSLDEEGVDEELLSAFTTSKEMLNFCPLTVTVSTTLPGVNPTCTEPSAVTTSPVLLNSMNQRFQLLRSNVCTLLNVMVSYAAPAATVCSRLPVTTTCVLSLLLEGGATLLLDSSLDEDTTELEEATLLLDSTLEELGGTTLEDDSTELEEATLELLFSEELLGASELEEGSSLLLDSSLEELGGTMLDEDSAELEETTLLEDCFTVIFPVADVLLSIPVTATV